MNDLRTAAQQALEALERLYNDTEIMVTQDQHRAMKGAITALRAALVEDALQKFTDVSQEIEAALAELVQEPVAWVHPTQGHMQRRTETMSPEVVASYGRGGWTPLYAAPPQRKPLTEEEIDSLWASEKAFADIYAIVRAIERAHGITKEMK